MPKQGVARSGREASDMRSKLLLSIFLLAQLSLAEPLQTVITDPEGDGPWPAAERVEGRLILDFQGSPSEVEMNVWGKLFGLSPKVILPTHGLAMVDVAESELPELLSRLKRDPMIQQVSPDYVVHVSGFEPAIEAETRGETAAKFPNDPLFKHQWHHKMVGASKAWKKAKGEGVTVAILDTGIAYAEKGVVRPVEDLAQTKILEGYDFINDDPLAVDDLGYGTHLAGTVAQSTNNKLGAAGLAFESRLMPVKVLNHEGQGTFGGIAAGIRFAADNGADVLVMGFGSTADSMLLEEAVEYAHAKGCVLVAAVGVAGDDTPNFPAHYDQVIGVGAVGDGGKITDYSSRGADIMGPGGEAQVGLGILQNALHVRNPKRSGYLWFAGTNCAAAHVGAAAALVISSGVKEPVAVREILLSTARKKKDKKAYGAGIVQADKAVKKAHQTVAESKESAFEWLALLLLALLSLPAFIKRK